MATIVTLNEGDAGDTSRTTINDNFTNVNTDLSTLDSGKEDSITTLSHEKGGLEADISSYTGLLAVSGGATSEVDTKAELEAQISDISDLALADGDIYTGTHDFGGADDLEVPNGATPTVDTDGQVAIDTSVTDFSHGIMKIYGGEEQGVVSMPIAEFTSPIDGAVPTYNATSDEFEMVKDKVTTAYKTADESVTTETTLSDDADLTLTIDSSGLYAIDASIYVTVASSTPDLKDAFKGTSSTTGVIASSESNDLTHTDIDDSPTGVATSLTGNHMIHYNGIVDVGATGGSLTYQWAQNTSDGDATTIKKGSWIKLTKLN